MDWSDIAKQVISLGAPVLGAALGGPLGGAAGKILAEVIGAASATPHEVGATLPSVPAERIAEAENRWADAIRAEAEAQRTAVAETQQTIRAEIASDDVVQKWWRPFYALELILECAALWAVLVHEFWTRDLQTINALIGASGLFIAYWGFRFGVLGVYVSGRTREKVSALTGTDAPGPLGQIAKSLMKKK